MAAADPVAAVQAPGGWEALLQQLMSADDAPRKAAEAAFEAIKGSPDVCAGGLLTVVRTSASLDYRSFAAIMLRRVSHVK
jgi:hypothetical protein